MLKKTVTVLSCLFLIQLLASCFNDCNCPSQQDRPSSFNALNARAEYEFTQQDSSIQLLNFFIFLEISGTELGPTLNSFNFDGLGFSRANACDCVPPSYSFNNSADSVNIFLLTSDSTKSEITDWFFYANGEFKMPINEYFQQQEDPFLSHLLTIEVPVQLDPTKISSLPELFKLEVKLFHQGAITLSDTLTVDRRGEK